MNSTWSELSVCIAKTMDAACVSGTVLSALGTGTLVGLTQP